MLVLRVLHVVCVFHAVCVWHRRLILDQLDIALRFLTLRVELQLWAGCLEVEIHPGLSCWCVVVRTQIASIGCIVVA